MHPGRRWTAVVPVLFAALLVLAGCSGSAAHPAAARRPAPTTGASSTPTPAPARTTTTTTPASASTPTSTPRPNATATLAPPVMPYAATLHTAEGADAYVRYWFAVLQYAYLTGDTAYFNRYSLPQCTACQRFTATIRTQYGEGSSFRGFTYDLIYISAPPPDTYGSVVDFGVTQNAFQSVNSAGRVDGTEPANLTQRASFFARWSTLGWRTFDVSADE